MTAAFPVITMCLGHFRFSGSSCYQVCLTHCQAKLEADIPLGFVFNELKITLLWMFYPVTLAWCFTERERGGNTALPPLSLSADRSKWSSRPEWVLGDMRPGIFFSFQETDRKLSRVKAWLSTSHYSCLPSLSLRPFNPWLYLHTLSFLIEKEQSLGLNSEV